MIRYSVELLPRAKKSLSGLSKLDAIRVAAAIELLRENPVPPRAAKLRGRDGYRVRVGKIRIIYTFDGEKLIILILDIGPRREIYKR